MSAAAFALAWIQAAAEPTSPDWTSEVGIVLALAGDRLAFAPPATIPLDGPDAVGSGDFDGDGHADLLVAYQPARAAIYSGNGTGGFDPQPRGSWAIGHGQAKKLAIGDLDGDGLSDAVVLGWDDPRASLISGGRERIRTSTLATGRNPWGLTVADLNGDGLDDVAIASEGEHTVGVYLSPNDR